MKVTKDTKATHKEPKKQKCARRHKTTKRQMLKREVRNRKLQRELKKEQNSTKPAIKKASFARVVKEIIASYTSAAIRITPKAMNALQEEAERYITGRLSDASAIANRHNRQTPNDEDLKLICSLKPLHTK